MYNKYFKKADERFFITASMYHIRHTATEEVQLEGSVVSAVDKDGVDVSTTLLDQTTIALLDHPDYADGTNACLTIRCRAGTAAKSPYKVLFTMETTLGNIFQVSTDLVIIS